MLQLIWVFLSFNAVKALVPVLIVGALIAAAAGLSRNTSIFALFGVGTVLGSTGRSGVGRGQTTASITKTRSGRIIPLAPPFNTVWALGATKIAKNYRVARGAYIYNKHIKNKKTALMIAGASVATAEDAKTSEIKNNNRNRKYLSRMLAADPEIGMAVRYEGYLKKAQEADKKRKEYLRISREAGKERRKAIKVKDYREARIQRDIRLENLGYAEEARRIRDGNIEFSRIINGEIKPSTSKYSKGEISRLLKIRESVGKENERLSGTRNITELSSGRTYTLMKGKKSRFGKFGETSITFKKNLYNFGTYSRRKRKIGEMQAYIENGAKVGLLDKEDMYDIYRRADMDINLGSTAYLESLASSNAAMNRILMTRRLKNRLKKKRKP